MTADLYTRIQNQMAGVEEKRPSWVKQMIEKWINAKSQQTQILFDIRAVLLRLEHRLEKEDF